MKREVHVKVFSGVVTFLIISMIVLVGPAQAFSLRIGISNENPGMGENISFELNVNVEPGEILPLTELRLEINGPTVISCEFFPNGSKITGCDNLSIQRLDATNFTFGNRTFNFTGVNFSFGYGYGYEGGVEERLKYNVTLNSSILSPGIYTTNFRVKVNHLFNILGPNFTILGDADISNISLNDLCVLSDENVSLMADFNGTITNATFSYKVGSDWINISIPGTSPGTFDFTLNNTNYNDGDNVMVRFFGFDIGSNFISSPIINLSIHNITRIEVSHGPDGLNGWYVSEPIFTLVNGEANKSFYEWDSLGPLNYTGPFGLEDSPNDGNVTGGILQVKYRSDVCNETIKTKLIMADFRKPEITNLNPNNNSIVGNTTKPKIEALLDEIYQSNSGINKSSVKMKLNGADVPVNVSDTGLIDAIVMHQTGFDLTGNNNVTVNVSDNAGWNSQLTWFFSVNLSDGSNITIHAPNTSAANTRRNRFNVSISKVVERIEYINHESRRPRWRRLCRICDEYGFARKKIKSLLEGFNNLSFRTIDIFGNIEETNVSKFIDSKKPRISRIKPRRNSVINGSLFEIKYTEDNLDSIKLIFNPEITLINCTSGRNQICGTSVDLTAFDNTMINYHFLVSDGINEVKSRMTKVLVDTTSPVINDFNITINKRRVTFFMDITEKNFRKVEYIDWDSRRPRLRSLCSRLRNDVCGRTRGFRRGDHNVTLRVLDDAGNTAEVNNILFSV